VETADTEELFAQPNHPYTRALLEEIPGIEGGTVVLPGEGGDPFSFESAVRMSLPPALLPHDAALFRATSCPEGDCAAAFSACYLNEKE